MERANGRLVFPMYPSHNLDSQGSIPKIHSGTLYVVCECDVICVPPSTLRNFMFHHSVAHMLGLTVGRCPVRYSGPDPKIQPQEPQYLTCAENLISRANGCGSRDLVIH